MDSTQSKSSSSYEKPPWFFKGSALYQFHLVKADAVRSIIPKELKLVEAFGYTLGGFFLASYDESPAATFDELVVIAGIVWNPPTSCAWAANVLVSSNEACVHGRKAVGLPSRVAKFSKIYAENQSKSRKNTLLGPWGFGESSSYMDVEVSETTGRSFSHLCNITIPTSLSEDKSKWVAPEIKMNLPSFSGRTQYNENLLKYSCEIRCRLSVVKAAIVSRKPTSTDVASSEGGANDAQNLSVSVMLSKPILALKFDSLKMMVDAPVIVSSKEVSYSSPGSICTS